MALGFQRGLGVRKTEDVMKLEHAVRETRRVGTKCLWQGGKQQATDNVGGGLASRPTE